MAKAPKKRTRSAPKGKLDKELLGPSSAATERAKAWQDLPRFYRWKRMTEDPQLGLALAVIDAPIVSAPVSVECQPLDDSDAAKALATEIASWVSDNIAARWRKLSRMALKDLRFGFAPVEKEFFVDEDGLYNVKFRDYDPEDSTPLKDENGDYAGVKYRGQEMGSDRCMLFVNEQEFGNLWGRSRFKRVEGRWWSCENIYKLLEGYLERKADPPAKGRAPNEKRRDTAGTEYNPMEKLGDALKDLRNRGYLLLPSERDNKGNFVYDAEWMTDDQRAQLFVGVIQFYETMKFRGMLAPERTATQDQSTGSYGMAETQTDVFMTIEEAILGDILDVLNEQLVDQLVTANWGADAPRARLATTGLSKAAKSLMEKIFTGLASSYPQAFASIIDLIALCEGYDIPMVDGARELLDRLQKQASMGVVPPSGTVPSSVQLKDKQTLGDEPPDVIAETVAKYGPAAQKFFDGFKAKLGAGVPGGRPFPGRRRA